MKARANVLIWALIASGVAGASLADRSSTAYDNACSPQISAARQPNGKPTKASSFAPHPGGSHRHVYGAPIQSPILHTQAKKPSAATTPK